MKNDILKNNEIHIEACPFCGGQAYIDVVFNKMYINAHHTNKCKMRPNTWLLGQDTLTKQIKAWNMREKKNNDT